MSNKELEIRVERLERELLDMQSIISQQTKVIETMTGSMEKIIMILSSR